MRSTPQRPSIELQDRDLVILRGLFESRVMTLAHIAALFFGGKSEAAKKRIQKLKAAGYVRERPRRPYEPSVIYLARAAFELLWERGHLADYPRASFASLEKRAQVSDLTLRHELEVMDVKAALQIAINDAPRFRVAEFSTWPLLCQFRVRQPDNGFAAAEVLVKPDGFIRVHEEDDEGLLEHAFYLEVDRSTEVQETLVMRAACYASHYRGGGFAVQCGGERSRFQEYPFRVLMVFKNAERRNNAAERMLRNNPPIHTQVWQTTLAEIATKPLGAIWTRPVDYRDAVRGTSFDIQSGKSLTAYRRQSDREEFVEQNVPKHTLLGDLSDSDS